MPAGKAVKNYMGDVFCPAKGALSLANSNAKEELVCTSCGYVHPPYKGFIRETSEPSKAKKGKGFKKGRKQK